MAKAPTSNARSATRKGWWLVATILAVTLVAGWHFWAPVTGYANAASAYSARVVCSCRFVAGRSHDDCPKDRLGGMELVTLIDDEPAKSVTARFPLLASDTATYREGYGCVLEEWDG